ncbi:ArsR/SmtB family transcription factor [Gynurincola endophyticus]|jgi:ArsR family transcriptional regulator|uniref:ArsR/SmtB family transcription factor n=1 Tax=Gynurincola endophyticus TaxID=2479004 RepID=UPI000F8CD557|nr:metalloregulator ArsR/SmtB family transcription factor [Gynurincola endophyticus]
MAYSKGAQFSQQQQMLAKVAKAISHPARIAIIDHLMTAKESICGEIVNEIRLAQPTVSQHLKELKTAGLIDCKIEGNVVRYFLNVATLELLGLYVVYVQNKLSPERKLKVVSQN